MTLEEIIQHMKNGARLRWVPNAVDAWRVKERLDEYESNLFLDGRKLTPVESLLVTGHPELFEDQEPESIECEVPVVWDGNVLEVKVQDVKYIGE